MVTQRKDIKNGLVNKDLVNFSVRAQDYIVKTGGGVSFRTTDDLVSGGLYPIKGSANQSISIGQVGTNATTNLSQEDHSKFLGVLNKSLIQEMGDQLLLPSIKSIRKNQNIQQSPFKSTFFDASATSQKMRHTAIADRSSIGGGTAFKQNKIVAGGELDISGVSGFLKEKNDMRASHSMDRKMTNKMNPKVLETWINETLQDAEHLDIPGVILKPEHKNPISRYGIDRLALTNAGIPNDMVDRIFRALFVYSVGFYELIKKCLQHTEKKYSIITAIWKVYSILLEYCCKTDYRMLISEISKEHKDELDKLEKEYLLKFQEQAHNERILKQNMEILQKYNEDLEKERTNERQMRLKLEEEYMQNTKNHEEEVQLRLKFESKLNNMHSVHRDLETKYKRALNEMAVLQNTNEQLSTKNNNLLEEITQLKTIKAENESRISYNEEKLASLQREINIKIKQVEDYEQRYTTTQDDLDLTKYKLQEAHKDITELKLKLDVYDSQFSGLKNEKQHLQLELKETKELQKIYEKKCSELMIEINKINVEYQDSKREIIGFGEIQKEREERIEKLKKDLKEVKLQHEELDLKHGTLSIQHDKIKEQYETCRKDLDDAIEKLHVTNKVRHETEVKLHEEEDKNRTLSEIIRDKEDQLSKRTQEIEDLDKKCIDLERTNEALEIKKAGIERQYELTKKQLNEKVQNLNDVLSSEKETREMWIERYEKEQRDHTATNAQLLSTKSQLKDQILQTKNTEIKLQTLTKANEVLSESNNRLQDNLNDTLAKCENLEREINTQKEIMKQMDAARKEYIQKLKRELETVESRFYQQIDRVEMLSEDKHSRAAKNFLDFQLAKFKLHETQDELAKTKDTLEDKVNHIEWLECHVRQLEMQSEDYYTQIFVLSENNSSLSNLLSLVKSKCEQLEETNRHLKVEADQKLKYQNDYNELVKTQAQLKRDLLKQKNSHVSKQNSIRSNDRQDVQVQTVLLGQNLDSISPKSLVLESQSFSDKVPSKHDSPAGLSKGIRVGGGGEIRKAGLRNNQKQSSFQANQTINPQLIVGGPGQIPQQQTIGGVSNQIQRSNNQSQQRIVDQTISNQGSNATLSSQMTKGNLELPGQTPHNAQQLIQGLYPQTTTNNQKIPGLQFSALKGGVDTQMTSPRNRGNQVQYDNYQLNKQGDLESSNMDETMITKQSPVGYPNNQLAQSQQDFDNNKTLTSVLQSPQGIISINFGNQRQGGPFNFQQTSLMNQSQSNMPHECQTIQSQQYLQGVNYSQDQNQQYPHAIPEQQDEYEEERKTSNPGDRSNKNSSFPNANAARLQNNASGGVRGSSRENFGARPTNGNVVEFKNMNTVMQSNKNIAQQQQIENGSGNNSNKGKQSNNTMRSFGISKPESQIQNYNDQLQQYSQYHPQQIYSQQTSPLYQYQQQQQFDELEDNEDLEISRQNEESLGVQEDGNSIMNQSIYNNMNQQQQQMIYNKQQLPLGQNRMKVDIMSSSKNNISERRQIISNNINNNGNSQVQSPLSQVSGYSNNLVAQNRFGNNNSNYNSVNPNGNGISSGLGNAGGAFNQTNNSLGQHGGNLNGIGGQQQNLDNRKVVGKTSIRTLIKSAATRDQ